MQIKTAEGAAFIVALVMSALSIGGATIDYFIAGGPWEWYYVSYTGGVFIAGYFISRWVIRKFIVYRIKPIYQIALSRNIKIRELESRFINEDNVIEDIGREVTHWVEASKDEIQRLKENEKYRREFVGDMSHELKTPLFNIQGYLTTLAEGGIDDPEINREYLQRAEKNVERLIDIVNDLDIISKLESGMLQLNKVNFDIAELCRSIADTLKFQADSRDIRISVQKSDTPLTVCADMKYMEQVVANLITNSIRYGNDGGHTRITFVDMFEKVAIEVTDDGIGIGKEHLPYIFDRFYRVDKACSREQGGTGLGLSIIKHIISAHEEGIIVRSTPGKGTTFSFTITKAAPSEEG